MKTSKLKPIQWIRTCLKRIKRAFTYLPKNKAGLSELINTCYQHDIINLDTMTMLESVMEFSPMRVRDIVLPKSQMISISHNASFSQIADIVAESGHSRFPVTGENPEEIIGILHAKDLLRFQDKHKKDFELYDLLRTTSFVPESKRLLALLSEFRKNRTHMAIVVDEYGEVSGLITLEDIIEQIIGDIEDEFDIDNETFIKSHEDGRYTLKGHTPIEFFNETLQTDFSDVEYDTMAGIITAAFAHLPKRGETIHLKGLDFKVLHADTRRVQLLECFDTRKQEEA